MAEKTKLWFPDHLLLKNNGGVVIWSLHATVGGPLYNYSDKCEYKNSGKLRNAYNSLLQLVAMKLVGKYVCLQIIHAGHIHYIQ